MIANPLEREIELCWLSLCDMRFNEKRTISLMPDMRLVQARDSTGIIIGAYTNRISLAEFRADVEFCLWQKGSSRVS